MEGMYAEVLIGELSGIAVPMVSMSSILCT
jgi:hypothetical protein